MSLPTFLQWMKEHCNNCGKPSKPSKLKKVGHDEKCPKGVRCQKDDLSTDYPGNIEFQGDVGPYNVLSKKGSPPPGP